MITCPECDGEGKTIASHVRYADGTGAYNVPMKCTRCNGTGQIAPVCLDWIDVGEQMRKRRLAARMNMRELGIDSGLSCVEVSKMEHGHADPARLVEYWKAKE